jgi:heptosyltransferase-3
MTCFTEVLLRHCLLLRPNEVNYIGVQMKPIPLLPVTTDAVLNPRGLAHMAIDLATYASGRPSLAAVRRILVIRPNPRLGNALLMTPLVHELEARFPDAVIEIVTGGSSARAVFQEFKQVVAIHAFPGRSYRSPLQVLALLGRLACRSYDLAIDPNPRSRSARFLLGLIRARLRIGFVWRNRWRDRMLTHGVDPDAAPAHCAQTAVYLLRTCCPLEGAGTGTRDEVAPLDLRLTASELLAGEQRLASMLEHRVSPSRPSIGFFADASGRKLLPVVWWQDVISILRVEAPAIQFLEFTPADGRARLGADIPGLHTPDLRLLGATLAATSLVVIADCGVMHLAGAAGARVLGLFKVTEPSRYGPTGRSSETLLANDERADVAAKRIREILEIA